MNVGRIVLGVSTVFAVAGAAAFVVVVASPAPVTTDSNFSACALPTYSGKAVFGMDVTNNSDHPLTISSFAAESTAGLSRVRYWALAPTDIGKYGFGVSPAKDLPGWSTRRSVVDAPLPPHKTVGIVIDPVLAAGTTKGFATNFALTLTRHSGVSWTQTSNAGYGYAPIDSSGTAENCWH